MKTKADLRPSGRQITIKELPPELTNRTISTPGQLHPYLGDAIESLLSKSLGARRRMVQAGRFCPDLSYRGIDIEVKAMGPKCTNLFIHESQVEHFTSTVEDYWLAIVKHDFKEKLPIREDLLEGLVQPHIKQIIILNTMQVRRFLIDQKWSYIESGKRKGMRIYQGQVNLWNKQRDMRRFFLLVGDRIVEAKRCSRIMQDQPVWPSIVRKAASLMREELQYGWMTVIPTPAPQPKHAGHMIRTVSEDTLPPWYRRLLAENPKKGQQNRKHPRSVIWRQTVLQWLKLIESDKHIARPSLDKLSHHLTEYIQTLLKELRHD